MTDFARFLHADGPNPEHAAALQLYGRFVGDWDAEITAHGPHATKHTAFGEIHFGWVLEGRAVQDVWIIPRPAGSPVFPIAGNWYARRCVFTIRPLMRGGFPGSIPAAAYSASRSAACAGRTSCRKARPKPAN